MNKKGYNVHIAGKKPGKSFVLFLKRMAYLVLMLVIIPSIFARDESIEKNNCNNPLKHYNSLTDSHHREHYLISLLKCPKSSKLARVSEYAIKNDDIWVRKVAWESFKAHKDTNSIQFLLEQFNQGELLNYEKEIVFNSLQELVDPNYRQHVEYIFIQGSFSPNKKIRHDSLLGLGKIKSARAIDVFQRVLKHSKYKNETIMVLLKAMMPLKSGFIHDFARKYLYYHHSGIQKLAIELAVRLDQKKSFEELLILQYKGPYPENQAILYNNIQQNKKIINKEIPWIATKRVQVVRYPSDRSKLRAVLAPYSIVYEVEKTRHEYRKYTNSDHIANYEGPYIKIYTSNGIEGWVFRSGLQKIF